MCCLWTEVSSSEHGRLGALGLLTVSLHHAGNTTVKGTSTSQHVHVITLPERLGNMGHADKT